VLNKGFKLHMIEAKRRATTTISVLGGGVRLRHVSHNYSANILPPEGNPPTKSSPLEPTPIS